MSESSLGTGCTYRAFLSYSHADKSWADWLHKALETYRVPSRLVGTQTANGVIPRRLQPIFRDREELASATDLGHKVNEALARSENLIVICSPASAASHWVNEEVSAYRHMGRGERIFCLIVDGEPTASDWPGHEAEECFCPALRRVSGDAGEPTRKRTEPVAADARPGKDGKANAKLKLIAGMLGVGFDTLMQREAHRRRRRLLVVTAASLVGMAIALGLAINAYIARNEAREREAQTQQALNFMLGDLHEKLEATGRLDLMAAVTDRAMALFAAVKPGSLTDLELTQQSRALVQIGEIRLKQAQYAPAMEAFRRAEQRSAELTARHPDDGRFLFDRAQAEYWIGYVYWQQRKLTDANTWLTRYRDSTLALLKIDPHNKDWELETGDGEHNLAVLALQRGDLGAAQHGFEAELAVFERLAKDNPEDLELASDISDSLSWLGIVADRRGDLAEAQRLFGEQASRYGALRSRHPQDTRWLAKWATAQELLAASLATTGRMRESMHALSEAADAYRNLTQIDPANIPWRTGMASVQVRRASYAWIAKRLDEAESLATSAIEGLQKLGPSSASHDRQSIPRVLSRGWLVRARLARDRGNLHDAAASAAQSLAEARNEAAPDMEGDSSLVDQANALLVVGFLQQVASPDEPPLAWTQAHALLASRVADSHYWALLDPWLRVCLLTGDDAGAREALDRLNASGYVPLQPWPVANDQPSPAPEGDQHVH